MKVIELEKFARLVSTCSSISSDLNRKVKEKVGSETIHADVRRRMRMIIDDSSKLFRALDFTATVDQLARIGTLNKTKDDITYERMQPLFAELLNRLYDETKRAFVLLVPSARAEYYLSDAPFGEAIATAFPQASFDLREAARCFALGCGTACVLHLMRAVEGVLEAAAGHLSISYQRNGWGPFMAAMRKALEVKYPRKDDHELRRFFDEFLERIAALKDAVRNPSMHGVTHYNMEEAEDVFRATRAFMKTAAQRLQTKT